MECRLVTYGRWHTAEQCGYLGACLNESENVVDEEQYVLVLLVTEVLSHCEAAETNSHTHSRCLVHLSEDHGSLVHNAGFPHLFPEIVSLSGTLAYSGEYGVAAVLHGYVVNQLLDKYRLAYSGAAEEADLSAL